LNDRIAIGRVSKPHGVHGDLRIISLSGEREHFLQLEQVVLVKGSSERCFDVEAMSLHGKDLLAKLGGIDSPEKAAGLAGSLVLTGRENACPLEEGEYYQADLLGCSVYYRSRLVGTVVATVENGPKDLLEIRTDEGPRLIPFEEEYIGEIRTGEKSIELRLDWLL